MILPGSLSESQSPGRRRGKEGKGGGMGEGEGRERRAGMLISTSSSSGRISCPPSLLVVPIQAVAKRRRLLFIHPYRLIVLIHSSSFYSSLSDPYSSLPPFPIVVLHSPLLHRC